MIGLSQTSVYAVQALSRMSVGDGRVCLIRDLAAMAGVPKAYLAKIINKLTHSGLVHARRGYLGGVALCRRPNEISVLEVVEAVEGKDWISGCLLETGCCGTPEGCPTGKRWTKLREDIKRLLRRTTLAETTTLPTPKIRAPQHHRGRRRRVRSPQIAVPG